MRAMEKKRRLITPGRIICLILCIIFIAPIATCSYRSFERARWQNAREREAQRLLIQFRENLPEQSDEDNQFLDMLFEHLTVGSIIVSLDPDIPHQNISAPMPWAQRENMGVLLSEVGDNGEHFTLIALGATFSLSEFFEGIHLVIHDGNSNINIIHETWNTHFMIGQGTTVYHGPISAQIIRHRNQYIIFGRATSEYTCSFTHFMSPEIPLTAFSYSEIEFRTRDVEEGLTIPINSLEGFIIFTAQRFDSWRVHPYNSNSSWPHGRGTGLQRGYGMHDGNDD